MELCRACMNKDESNMLNASRNFETFKKDYSDLTQIKIPDSDDLPNLFCNTCSNQLQQFKLFKSTCLKSYETLKQTAILFVKTELDYDPPFEVKLEEDESKNNALFITATPAVLEDIEYEDTSETSKAFSKRERRRNDEVNESEESEDTDNGDNSFQAPSKKTKSESGKFTHKCPEKGCKRSFGSQPSLDAHLRIHGGATPGVCDICEKPLSSVKAMRKHRLTHLSISERSFSCEICFKIYVSETALKSHMKEHSGTARKHICDICGLGYGSTSILNNHKSTHSAEKQFKCDQCDKAYRNRTVLYNHKKLYHERKNEIHTCKICDKIYATKIDDNDMLPKRFCLQCSGLLKQFKDFKDTCIKSDAIFKSQWLGFKEETPQSIADTTLPISVKIEDAVVYNAAFNIDTYDAKPKRGRKQESLELTCNFCSEQLPSVKAMRQHMKIHEEESAGEESESESGSHSENEVSKRRDASKKATKKYKLMNKCTFAGCGKLFRLQSNLEAHMRVHEGGKKSIWSHYRTVHTVYTTTENIFQCFQCGMKLKNLTCLQKHIKLHEGERKYACPECPKTFAHAAVLKRHSYFHSGDWPVHCAVCKKGFYEKRDMQVHMNIHKRQMIAEGQPGVALFNRNKKKITETGTSGSGEATGMILENVQDARWF